MNKLEEVLGQVADLLKSVLPQKKIDVVKSVNEEERLALFVAMEPDEFDAHGDTTSVQEVAKACHNFNEHCMRANLFHLVETEDAIIRESYIAPVEMQIGERNIKKGTWLQSWFFPETETGDVLWQMVKDGEITGISIGARATVEEIN